MKKFVGPTAKTCAYLMDNDTEHKKAKGTKKCKLKRGLKNCKDCLFNDKIILKSKQGFKSEYHHVYTEKINEIALSSNDDKILQTFDKIKSNPFRTNTFEVY